jgi:Carboxypeptidase regulatory-like domain
MCRLLKSTACALTLLLSAAATAGAQGVQTGILTGTVTSSDGLSLPGATVTVESPALQGSQTAVTDVNGNYVFRGLPHGEYRVTFEMGGLSTVGKTARVELGRTVTVDATLAIAGVAEEVTVAAEPAPVVTNPTNGANFSARVVNELPMGRTPFTIAELSPGLTDNGPNVGQVTISGAFAYDNVFLIDGVDVNDNLFGTSHNLFIEDAIDETQVLTSGVSAEYGRFSGGVINVVTKRGGDIFSGSYRQNVNNASWTDEVPFETRQRPSIYSNVYEGTLGGPIVRSKLWFFSAGRYENSTEARTFLETRIPYDFKVDNKRYEVKGTATPFKNHTFQASWVDNRTEQANRPGLPNNAIEPRTLVTRQLPNDLFVTNWNGVLSSRLFATAQVSQKRFGFRNTGGTSTAIIDSPFRTRGVSGIPANLHYNAPFFDSSDPEDRNNRQVAASLSYFLSSPSLGSHDLKAGFEWFRSTNTGGNSQTSTGYVFYSDYLHQAGTPIYDSQARLIPVFVPNTSRLYNWLATRGARIDIKTTSLYVHDRWAVNRQLTIDAGLRFERVRSDSTGDITGADTDTIVPRLAATFDPKGNGKLVLQTTYAHYAGKYSEAQFANNTDVGNPSLVRYVYTGPAGQGLDFAPGLDVNNYTRVLDGNFPTANVFFEEGLHSPVTREFTVSAGSQLTDRAYVKGSYIWRSVSGFIEDFITIDNGTTTVIRNGVNFGTFDNVVYRNTDEPMRDYQGLLFQAQYRVRSDFQIAGNWTVQLKNEGDFEGEASNQPGNPTLFGDYPEVFSPERNFPIGRFDDFQRHKVRLWGIYNLSTGRFGGLDLSALWKYNSGLAYSLVATGVPLSAEQLARDPGYANVPNGGSQNLFFGERGIETFSGYALVDLGVNYSIPVWRRVRPYAKFELLNAFNNQKLIGFDRTVLPDNAGPKDELGLPLNYIEGPNFGKATRNLDYPTWRPGFDGGRTFQFAFGMRF